MCPETREEDEKRKELREMSEEERRRKIRACLEMGNRRRQEKTTSGLVEIQKWFMKMREKTSD